MAYLLKRLYGNLGKGKSGFTLVELLIVVAIIVALGAVIVPNVLQFADRGDAGAQAAEWDAVQAAMDAMMAAANPPITGVTANDLGTTGTSEQDWTSFPAGAGSTVLNPTFLRDVDGNSTYFYCWDDTGAVTEQFATATACTN